MTQEDINRKHNILIYLCYNKSFPYSIARSRQSAHNDKKFYYDKLIPSGDPERYSSENDYLKIHAANKFWHLIVV